MNSKFSPKKIGTIGAASLICCIASIVAIAASNNFFGAIFTSTSTGVTVNANLYDSKADVYLNGGPQGMSPNGLPNGTYYFQVTDPSGATLLSTDNAVCRQLVVANGVISGASPASGGCIHANGTFNPANGSTPVQLIPFADTPNNGGEYKAWLIRQTSQTSIDATDPKVLHFDGKDEKTDNFKVKENCDTNPDLPVCNPDTPPVFLSGHKFYDANANTLNDDGQVVAGVKIQITYTTPEGAFGPFEVLTLADGSWSYGPIPAGAGYVVSELLPCIDDNNDLVCDAGHYWVQTAPVADSNGFQGYNGTANSDVADLDFGNVCFEPASGGFTLGFWSNKNGEKTMRSTLASGVDTSVYPTVADNPAFAETGPGLTGDLNFLSRLNLKNSSLDKKTGNIMDFDPTDYTPFRTWLLNGNAVNMAYMLSVQLSATSLDVRHKSLFDSQIVDGTSLGLGYPSIGSVRRNANIELNLPGGNNTFTGNPLRQDEEILKDFLDAVNNNKLAFASATPCNVFYAPPPVL